MPDRALFPSTGTYHGEYHLTSREIKTTNSGDIDLWRLEELNVGLNNLGSPSHRPGHSYRQRRQHFHLRQQ